MPEVNGQVASAAPTASTVTMPPEDPSLDAASGFNRSNAATSTHDGFDNDADTGTSGEAQGAEREDGNGQEPAKTQGPDLSGFGRGDRLAYERSRQALMRDGYLPDEIDALNPETVIRVGNTRFEAQRQRDALRPNPQATTSDRRAHPDRGTRAGGRTDGRPVQQRTERAFDDEGAPGSDPLDDVFDEPDTSRQERYEREERETARLQRQAMAERQRADAATIRFAEREVAQQFPMLASDPQLRTRVLRTMSEIDPNGDALDSGDPDRVVDIMRRACIFETAEQTLAETRALRSETRRHALNGQPFVPSPRQDTKSLGQNEVEDLAIRAIEEANGDASRAQAIMQRLLGSARNQRR